MSTTAAELSDLTYALANAKQHDLIKPEHAKLVFLKALEESGFNTLKPVKKEAPVITGTTSSLTVDSVTVTGKTEVK